MADTVDLTSILADKGLNKENQILKNRVTAKVRNKIAVKIGDWKSCAAFLGVPEQDVDDIIEENRRIRQRRIAMLRRWDELYGQGATYLRLAEGLASIGRRDVIELLISESQSRSNSKGHAHQWNRTRSVQKKLAIVCKWIYKSAGSISLV